MSKRTAAVLLAGMTLLAGMAGQVTFADDDIAASDEGGSMAGGSQLQEQEQAASGGSLFEDSNTNVQSKDGISADEDTVKDTARQMISGYAETGLILSITYDEGRKPDMGSLQKQFPSTVKVYLLGQKKAVDIRTSWKCVGEDYTTSKSRYFLFEPTFDEKKYQVRITDTPYIEVRQNPGVAIEMIESAPPAENEKEIFRFCTEEMGLSKAAACGILANMYCESGFRTNALGDSNTSVGICQWHNGRWTRLRSYTKDWQTLEGQLDYMRWELGHGYTATLNYLKNVSDDDKGAYDAAYFWCVHYEMPDSARSRGITRAYLAKNIYWKRYGEEAGEEDEPEDPAKKCSDSLAGEYIFKGQGSLNIRSGHSEDSDIIGSIPEGAKVQVTKANGEWAHVVYEGKTGLCSMDYLTLLKLDDETEEVRPPKAG